MSAVVPSSHFAPATSGPSRSLVVVAVSALNTSASVIDPLPLVAPALGMAVGLLAGMHSAWRAASLEPVDALRAGL